MVHLWDYKLGCFYDQTYKCRTAIVTAYFFLSFNGHEVKIIGVAQSNDGHSHPRTGSGLPKPQAFHIKDRFPTIKVSADPRAMSKPPMGRLLQRPWTIGTTVILNTLMDRCRNATETRSRTQLLQTREESRVGNPHQHEEHHRRNEQNALMRRSGARN